MKNDLTHKQQAFVDKYLECGNATEAYRHAYGCKGWKDESVGRVAFSLMRNLKISSVIGERKQAVSVAVDFRIADVLRELVDIATADANELVQHRRICCRMCHGTNHHYQWKDAKEFALARAEVMHQNAVRAGMRGPKPPPLPLPEDTGGYGFAFNAVPHEACPECRGEGKPDTFFADTARLTGKARKLYGGVKQTKDGLTIIMRDQDRALENIGKALGMFKNELKLVGPNGGPVQSVALPADATEAARVYQALMKTIPEQS